jgi:hypothetical protein
MYRSIPANSENGAALSTSATLTRHTKSVAPAAGG